MVGTYFFGHEMWKLFCYYMTSEVGLKGKNSTILWHNHTMAGLLGPGTDNVKNNKSMNIACRSSELNPPLPGLQQSHT